MQAVQSRVMSMADPERAIIRRILGFGRFLRENGFQVGVQEEVDALRVAGLDKLLDPQQLRWALRSLLCGDARSWARYDELFDAYWRRPNRRASTQSAFASAGANRGIERSDSRGAGGVLEVEGTGRGEGEGVGDDATRGGASGQEAIERSDFRFITETGAMQDLEELVERLARRMRRRLIRRQRIRAQGQRIHLRRTLRKSLRYGGTPFDLIFRRRRRELPRLVLILDVSRSMNLYSYLFLRFARGLVGAFRDAEAFVFHTRLVHITEALKETDLYRVREKLAVLSLGWCGGTRIGESLEAFNRGYGRRILTGRTVVMVMSDGFDTGSPEQLAEQLGRIRERARRIIWLNPLLGRQGYEPLAGGMQAALPLVDRFLPAHNLESLRALEDQLARA